MKNNQTTYVDFFGTLLFLPYRFVLFTQNVILYSRKTACSPVLMLCIACGIHCVASGQSNDHFYPVSLEQRIQQSRVIFEGKVLSSNGFWDEKHQNIFTAHKVQVYRYFKGEITSGNEVEIVTAGGTVDLQMERHSSALVLQKGQSGIFFCMTPSIPSLTRRTGISTFMIYSGPQGFIEYDTAEGSAVSLFKTYPTIGSAVSEITSKTGVNYQVRPNPEHMIDGTVPGGTLAVPVVTSFTPVSISAGTASVLTINGSNFNAARGTGYVEFRNANNGGSGWMQPLPVDYVSWTDNQIQVRVPSTNTTGGTAGSGLVRVTNSDGAAATSVDALAVTYAYSNIAYSPDGGVTYNVYMPDHVNDDGSNGYTFQYNSAFAATPAPPVFNRAMERWSCATGMNWRIGPNTAVSNAANDGVNVVTFSSTLDAGTLATATSYYSGCISGGNIVFWVTELDLLYNDTYTWNYNVSNAPPGQMDFESVSVHELGHAHQLDHVINSSRVMHFSIAAGTTKRGLTPDDIAGGNAVMANSLVSNTCGVVQPMTFSSCSQALPLTLVDFSGTLLQGKARLTWHTAQEISVKEFEMQHAFDGKDFGSVGVVAAKGNSTTETFYGFTGDHLPRGRHLYRLKAVDVDGSFTFSKIVALTVGDAASVRILENPIRQRIVVQLPIPSGRASIKLIDNSGRIILSRVISSSQSNVISIDVEERLIKGVYLLEIIVNNERTVHKLVKE